MTINEIREKFIKFYTEKGHAEIASSSLIPKNDPTTLFTGSGMQQLMPYLLGEEHKKGTRLVDSQKCFRADDIDEVGDNRHTTFFEMLGNWSLGDYFKEEQLPWVFEFLTGELGLDPKRIYTTVFLGDPENNIERDDDSVTIWQKLFASKGVDAKAVEIGSEENGYKVGMEDGRIFYYDSKKNWWSRAGVPGNMPAGEPGGPDSEIFYDFGTPHDQKWGEHCHPNCDCGRFMEIGNSVFMQYIKNEDGTFSKLPKQNVDFGGGLERIAAAANNDPDVFNIDIFKKIVNDIEQITGVKYSGADDTVRKSFRVLCDHMRAATFILGDGIKPSNLGQGYVLRRLIRRSIRFAKLSGLYEQNICSKIAVSIINDYKDHYKNLGFAHDSIVSELNLEEAKFLKTLESGTREFERITAKKKEITGQQMFELFTTNGFPKEMTLEIAEEQNVKVVSEEDFDTEFAKHQEISRAGVQDKKFASGLENKDDPKIIQYHTAAHLMLAGLRKVLGEHVHQKGSNITAERIRFDFSHPEKMTEEEKKTVENYVNESIAKKLDVYVCETDPKIAKEKGAEGEFSDKYGDKVTVYSIGGDIDAVEVASKEICTGPHVKNTGELGKFKITNEQSSSSGVRRIKAILE